MFSSRRRSLVAMPRPRPSVYSRTVKLVILDPGHFHATLIQKDMYPGVSPQVSVYAPLAPELLDYLSRIAQFNARQASPTVWELDVHTGGNFFERMLRERAGDVVVITGRNRGKIDRITRSLEAGFHVLADKPWIISSADMPKLEAALKLADSRNLVAYDIMTERFEITSLLQRELVTSPEIFGQLQSVKAMSVHHIMKMVAGVPIRRPVWFFDIDEYGEALADVGTHVVDLVQWTAFPDQPLRLADVQFGAARRWPTRVTAEHFRQVTGVERQGDLEYFCNNSVSYFLRGIPVDLEILWNWEAAPGAVDVYQASFRGTNARVEIRQGPAEQFKSELYVTPHSAALDGKIAQLQAKWPGVAVERRGGEARIAIPDRYHVGHEAHFAQVTAAFFDFIAGRQHMPAWETPYMLVKYLISTKGVEVAKT